MKKVSIFFLLVTIILTLTDKDYFKDLFSMFVIFGVSYLFGYYLIGKIHDYNRARRLENEIAEIFTDEFTSRLKRELSILKLKNEFRKISNSELCTTQLKE